MLVVDDEQRILSFLRVLLEEHGFAVATGETAEDALGVVSTRECAVAIVDKNLEGERSGLDVLREVSRLSPHTQVLIHTGYSSTESAVAALRAGAFDYLEKPIDNTLLIERVRRAYTAYEVLTQRDELWGNYETLFELVPGVVWFTTRDGVFRRIGSHGAQILGYEPEEIVGQDFRFLLPDDVDADAGRWAFIDPRSPRRPTERNVLRLKTKARGERLFEICVRSAYRTIDQRPVHTGTFAVAWDITDNMRALEDVRLGDKMEALGRMAGCVAQDFNNLLLAITSSLHLARMDLASDHPAQEDLNEISTAAYSAKALTERLLAFSRQKPVPHNPVATLAMMDSLRARLPAVVGDHVRVEVECPMDIGTIDAEEGELHQAVTQLALNAREAMPGGGVLRVRAGDVTIDGDLPLDAPAIAPGDYVLLAVADDGPGMPDHVREHALEPFFTTKEVGAGSGLGLTIVDSIVRKHGGYLWLASGAEGGTTVRIFLPRSRPTGDPGAPGPAA